MISVIVCSADDAKSAAVSEMYRRRLGPEPHEVVRVADARSLAEGYNRGVRRSRGDVLILSHDDVEVVSPDLPGCLRRHLSASDLVGVAGTTRLIGPGWADAGPPYLHGHVAHTVPGGFGVGLYGPPPPPGVPVQAMDGLFLAMRRRVAEGVPFDEAEFDGFHLYDIDFTFSAHRAGFRLEVCHDLHLVHGSEGQYSGAWQEYARRFTRKWAGRLATSAGPRRFQTAAVIVPTLSAAMEVMMFAGPAAAP